MFNLAHLEQLVTFAETGSLFNAAQILHLSQPSLTRSMQRLEAELGVPLFERKKNRITLNDNGRLAVEEARKILQQAREMESRIKEFDRRNRLISVASCAYVPGALVRSKLRECYSEAHVELTVKKLDQLLEEIKRNKTDLLVLDEECEIPEWKRYFFGKDQVNFFLPKSHPLSRAEKLNFADLNGESFLICSERELWEDKRVERLPKSHFIRQSEPKDFLEILDSSTLPTFTTDKTWRVSEKYFKNRVSVPIKDLDAQRFYYCYIKDSQTDRLSEFINRIQN